MDASDRGDVLVTPLTTVTVGEQIADRVTTAIALGEFTPGDRLPSERDLATRLEVSRGSVREAISRLTATGLIEVRRGRGGGAFVRTDWAPSTADAVRRTLIARWRDFEDLFDYRTLVESLIARTAAQRAEGDDRTALAAALDAFDAARSPGDRRRADADLHLAVSRATHNTHLIQLSRRLLSEVSLGFSAEPYTQELYERAHPQHHALITAVLDGEPGEAARIAADHFTITEDALRDLVARVE